MDSTYKIVYVDCTWEHDSKYYDWHPLDNDLGYKSLLVTLGVGLDKDKFDLFNIYITHATFFDPREYSDKTPVWVVKGEFDWNKVLAMLNSFIQNCKGENYQEVSENIRKRMSWEFEGYENVKSVSKQLINWIDLEGNVSDGNGID